MSERAEGIAGVLGGHKTRWSDRDDSVTCSCGHVYPNSSVALSGDDRIAHQADVMDAWLAEQEQNTGRVVRDYERRDDTYRAQLALYHEYVFVRGDACDDYGKAQLKKRLEDCA